MSSRSYYTDCTFYYWDSRLCDVYGSRYLYSIADRFEGRVILLYSVLRSG